MELLKSIFKVFAAEGEMPQNYDSYHFMWIGIALAFTVFMVCAFKNLDDKGVRRFAGAFWITLVVLEILKQLIFSIYISDGELVWDYAWYNFPFQFCASPLYVLPIIAFAKDGKFRDAAITFIATFSTFAGICVYVFPNDVFCHFTFVNAQAMFHHGVQVFFGIYLAFRYRDRMNLKNLLGATAVFSSLAGIAMILNEVVYQYLSSNGMGDTFNMYFISPHFDCTLPVLSIVHDLVPYPVFLCIYIFGFMLCAGLVMLLMKGLVKLTKYDK
jgi:hypothetical protein